MGNNSSNSYNEVNSFLSASMQMTSDESQQCVTSNKQHQDLNIFGVSGDVNIGYSADKAKTCSVDWSQTSNLDVTCLANQANQGSISADLNNKIEQASKALMASLTASIGNKASAKNITNSAVRLAVNMANTMQQNCNGSVLQQQGINIQNVKGSVNICNLSWDQIATNALACTQKAKNVQDAKAQLTQEIKASSSSQVESLLQPFVDLLNSWGMMLILPLLAMLFVGLGLLKTVSSPSIGNKIVIIAILLSSLVTLYFLLAFIITMTQKDGGNNLVPYKTMTRVRVALKVGDKTSEGSESEELDKELTRHNWIAFGVGFGFFFLLTIGILAYRKYTAKQATDTALNSFTSTTASTATTTPSTTTTTTTTTPN